MKNTIPQFVLPLAFMVLSAWTHPAFGVESLGAGNASLLGGDLTDPEDDVVDKGEYGAGLPPDKMRPEKGNWVEMKMSPVPPPGAPPHQIHAYQSWQNTPGVGLFLNKPDPRKWYIGFKDGGNGGPTMEKPYALAFSFKEAYALTHFTITTSPEMPGRDPRQWAIQGSNTGEDNDWTDIYKCDAKDRAASPFAENPRTATYLFTSFDSAGMEKAVSPADLKKLQAKLKDKKLAKADFARPANAYQWFRIVIYSCFNPNSITFDDFNRPPGFALGQMEVYGFPAMAKKVTPKPGSAVEPIKPAK